jgi:hypothetical protein
LAPRKALMLFRTGVTDMPSIKSMLVTAVVAIVAVAIARKLPVVKDFV